MRLSELKHGQVVRGRTGRAGNEGPAWGKWRDITLHLQTFKQGSIINLQNENWAEYTADDFDSHYKVFLVEDYYFQIEGLK